MDGNSSGASLTRGVSFGLSIDLGGAGRLSRAGRLPGRDHTLAGVPRDNLRSLSFHELCKIHSLKMTATIVGNGSGASIGSGASRLPVLTCTRQRPRDHFRSLSFTSCDIPIRTAAIDRHLIPSQLCAATCTACWLGHGGTVRPCREGERGVCRSGKDSTEEWLGQNVRRAGDWSTMVVAGAGRLPHLREERLWETCVSRSERGVREYFGGRWRSTPDVGTH